MAKSKKNIELTEKEFDQLLGSFGYTFPRSDQELNNFEEIYSNSEFKLKEIKINPDEIINETFELNDSVIQMTHKIDTNAIQSLKMAARKGESQIPDNILKRLKEKHNKKDESSD